METMMENEVMVDGVATKLIGAIEKIGAQMGKMDKLITIKGGIGQLDKVKKLLDKNGYVNDNVAFNSVFGFSQLNLDGEYLRLAFDNDDLAAIVMFDDVDAPNNKGYLSLTI